MRCEQARDLLPEYAEGGLRPPGALDAHLASCAGCRTDLFRYRRLLASLADLRDVEVQPPFGYLEQVIGLVPSPSRSDRVVALIRRRPGRVAVASVSGAAAATAVAIVSWRLARRARRDGTAGVALSR